MCNNFCFIDSNKYQAELKLLENFVEDGILELTEVENQFTQISITDLGRFFVRNIASCFDSYIRQETGFKAFSQAL